MNWLSLNTRLSRCWSGCHSIQNNIPRHIAYANSSDILPTSLNSTHHPPLCSGNSLAAAHLHIRLGSIIPIDPIKFLNFLRRRWFCHRKYYFAALKLDKYSKNVEYLSCFCSFIHKNFVISIIFKTFAANYSNGRVNSPKNHKYLWQNNWKLRN